MTSILHPCGAREGRCGHTTLLRAHSQGPWALSLPPALPHSLEESLSPLSLGV